MNKHLLAIVVISYCDLVAIYIYLTRSLRFPLLQLRYFAPLGCFTLLSCVPSRFWDSLTTKIISRVLPQYPRQQDGKTAPFFHRRASYVKTSCRLGFPMCLPKDTFQQDNLSRYHNIAGCPQNFCKCDCPTRQPRYESR